MKNEKEQLHLTEEAPIIELPAIIWMLIIGFSAMLGLSLLVVPWWIVLFLFLIICIAVAVFLNPLFGVIIFLLGAFFHPTQHFQQLQEFNLAQYLAIGVLLVWGFRTIVYRDFELVKSRVNLYLTLYLVVVFLSGTIEWEFASSMLIQQTTKVATLYLVIVNMVKTRRQSLVIIFTLVLIGTISALTGLYQQIFHIGEIIDEGALRIVGSETDPNRFAMHLITIFPIAVNLIWIERRKLVKAVLIGISALLLVCTILTYSRGSMVALVAVIFFIVIRPLFEKPRRITPLICVILAIILFLPFVPPRYWQRASSIADTNSDTSIRGRLEALKAGTEMVQEHPFRGVGFGMFELEYTKHTRATYVYQHPMSAHNMYITLVAESGIPALLIFFGLVFNVFKELRTARRIFMEKGDVLLSTISGAVEIGTIGFLVGGFFLSQLYLLIFWILISLSVALRHISLSDPLLPYIEIAKEET